MAPSNSFEYELSASLPRLRRFAHGLSRSTGDADDLTQMTIERALRAKAQWQPGSRLDSGLCNIMRNLWIDTVRSRNRQDRFEAPAEDAAALGHDPRDAIEAGIDLRRVMAAMDQLPDEQREVLALILIEG